MLTTIIYYGIYFFHFFIHIKHTPFKISLITKKCTITQFNQRRETPNDRSNIYFYHDYTQITKLIISRIFFRAKCGIQ